jgi:hypothetical protein
VTDSRTIRQGWVARCNIGSAEIARRRQVAAALTIATVAIGSALVAVGAPHDARILILPFASGAGVTWLQVLRRFCVRFGAMGVENFGVIGEETPVDRAVRAADARQAAAMVIEGVLIGLVLTLAFLGLPA